MGRPNPSILWKPGDAPYALWLKNLTPEEYKKHLEDRKLRKSMRKAMNEVVLAQQEQWMSLFHQGALKLMEKAIAEGDTQAYVAIYDRFIGKPESNVDVTSAGKAIQAPTIIFEAEELDEWKDAKR